VALAGSRSTSFDREKLSKTVTIDNFSCKPTGWYWEYTKEQQEEYFNKVFEKLVIANTPANDYELKRYFNYTYIDLILCLVISKFYHKNNFDIYGDLSNKYYYGVEEVLKDEYLEDNIIVNKTKMIVDLYYNKRGFNWKIERLVRFGVKDEYKVKYIRSILTEESIPEIMLKYIDIEDLSLVKPYDIELDI